MPSSRHLILAAAIALTVTATQAPSLAQNAPSREALEAAKGLVSLQAAAMASDFSAVVAAQTWPTIESSLRLRNPRIDSMTLNDLRREFERLQSAYFAELMNEQPAIYARYFTSEELREITAFYQTPTGSKALLMIPRGMIEFMGREMPRMQIKQQQMLQAFETILRARGMTL